MSLLNLDFTGIETSKRMSAGTHIVTISSAEAKTASSGNNMLAITYRDDTEDSVAYDNFVLLPQSMWKLKMFLEAVFQTPFTSKISLDPKNLVGRKLVIKTEDESYVNNEGNPAIRCRVLSDYAPIALNDMIGVAPAPAAVPNPTPVTPVTPTPNPTPVAPAPTVNTSQPQVSPTPTAPQVEVAPSATPSRPKLPWE